MHYFVILFLEQTVMKQFIERRATRSWPRRWALVAVVATVALPVSPLALQPASAQVNFNPIRVTLNGEPINFGGVNPVQQSNRILVPLRGVFEALGATVLFDPVTQSITATRGGNTRIQLTIGSTRAYVNGQARTLDVPAQLLNNRTLVPLRFVSEALGATVYYAEAQRTVLLTTPTDNTDSGNPNPIPATRTVNGNIVSYDNTIPRTLVVRVLDANSTDTTQSQTFNLADNARIYLRATRRIVRGQTPIYGAPVAQSSSNISVILLPGADVALRTTNDFPSNTSGDASVATVTASLVTTRIRDIQGDQIILDDSLGTTLNANANLTIVNAQGRRSNDASTLLPGSRAVLYIAPSNRHVYAVSATAASLRLADNLANNTGGDNTLPDDDTLPDDNGTNPGNASTPQINLVQQSATRPLRAGQTLSVTVRGTPGQRASFSVLPDVPEVTMSEDPNRRGVYTGTYVVQNGDNVLSGRVSAYLRNSSGREAFQQSQTAVTLDTTPPRITGTTPSTGATIPSSQSNIAINATDLGGSGLGSATVSFNGQAVAPEDITVSSNQISVIAPDNLSGQVSVNVSVLDRAGNAARRTFSYMVNDNGTGNGGNGSGNGIISLTHNATRDTQPGDRVTVNMRAGVGGSAIFDVLGNGNAVLLRNVRMTEISDGRYRATFTVPGNSDSALTIRGHFTDANGTLSTEETTVPIGVNAGDSSGNLQDLTIVTPRDGATVGDSVTIMGTASPNATIDVNIVAHGTRYYIFEYSNDLGTQQVQVKGNGNWSAIFNLPTPSNVSNLSYVVTATQTDSSNRQSQPVTITLSPRGNNDNSTGS